jgi:RecA-family ATPase
VDGLLYAGTYLFVGAPKVGKSFFVAQLAYHVSMGIKLWDYEVKKGTVLYLALEDTENRLQERLFRMYGTESAEDLHFTIWAKQLGSGLDEQLQRFVNEHPNTKLIIVDTLQKVREAGDNKFSYANDYEIVGKLKQFADKNHICLLLVHHTRKQQAEDKFDMISGTNGLLGAADGAFLLQKEKRTSDAATLDISGRDQQDQRLHLRRDADRLIWQFEKAETELWKAPPDPLLEAVAALVVEQPLWSGTATELAEKLGLDMKPNTLSMRLNVSAGRLMDEYNVRYTNERSHAGRCITLTLVLEA